MKLKEYNKSTALTRAVDNEPFITVNQKNGLINFNKGAINLLKLKGTETITFYQDEDNPLRWYFNQHPNGFKLREASSGSYVFGCKSLAKDIIDSLEVKGNSIRIPISKTAPTIDDNDYYLLDTFKVNQKFKSENVKPKRF
ncbi:hypothetical protein [Cyclobacterium marinum]|uniref:hypothetical protein n=1 Tax=Cyclobacterium marinum TaxID=104 RepID=UPI0030D7F79F|tara:strand:- start:44961 stop:45383 length:423 start_codon:yes stop_codon:yes gene_type:complete